MQSLCKIYAALMPFVYVHAKKMHCNLYAIFNADLHVYADCIHVYAGRAAAWSATDSMLPVGAWTWQ
jgi:hypothetical protein